MTIAADILTLGEYDTTDTTNAVAQAIKTVSLYMGKIVTEDEDEDIDEVIKQYAVYLLDRLLIQRRAQIYADVVVPPLITKEHIDLIKSMIQSENLDWSIDPSVPKPPLHWRNC